MSIDPTCFYCSTHFISDRVCQQYISNQAAREAELMDLAEAAWGVIANASDGDWSRQKDEWVVAAQRWRERYHAALGIEPAISSLSTDEEKR